MCKAFPDGIPLPIIAGDIGHLEPFPGDNGIQYEPVGDAMIELFPADEMFTKWDKWLSDDTWKNKGEIEKDNDSNPGP